MLQEFKMHCPLSLSEFQVHSVDSLCAHVEQCVMHAVASQADICSCAIWVIDEFQDYMDFDRDFAEYCRMHRVLHKIPQIEMCVSELFRV